MKTIIYYFSGTGNSLVVARDIAANIPDAKLIRIMPDIPTDFNEKTKIGIVFPVYSLGAPAIVKNFIEKINCPKDSYIFSVATCGGSLGHTFSVVEKALAKSGNKLSAAFGLTMPDNFIPFFPIPSQTQQKPMLEKEKEITKKIATNIIQEVKIPAPKTMGLLGALLTGIAYPLALKHFSKADKKFWPDTKCNGCGVCAKVCPVKNIAIKDNKPTWQHHCELCLACLHWCPQAAIQYGKISPKRGRYHHPELKLTDIIGE